MGVVAKAGTLSLQQVLEPEPQHREHQRRRPQGRTAREVAMSQFREEIEATVFASPAIVDGVIYLRTDKHLFAFGQ